MQKILALILALLYISSSTGATVHMHYCMGRLVDVNWGHDKGKPACGKCGTTHDQKKNCGKPCKKQCCKDEHKTIKLTKDQKIAENTKHVMQLAAMTLPVAYMELPRVPVKVLAEAFPASNAPPPGSKVHTYILNCIFRI
ncbi:hypothetical protein [Chitinophaga sp. 212800010-3]|uniref:HYC_CC_PP family protein n=1 Tax=unclassified Chitinophaga TaxID=2619133 RepID=UPI002DF3C8DF|nr:Secreted protein [Chitinophaga sp. 212800010-3]